MEWKPIESAPSGHVILYHPATISRVPLKEWIRVGWVGDTPNRMPTHWMPLPDAPK